MIALFLKLVGVGIVCTIASWIACKMNDQRHSENSQAELYSKYALVGSAGLVVLGLIGFVCSL